MSIAVVGLMSALTTMMGLRVGSLMVWVCLLVAIDGFGWWSLIDVGLL